MKILRYEIALWVALYCWIFRRPEPMPAGTLRFGYAGATKGILIAFIVVSALEIPILDLIIPWAWLRVVSVAVGVYGLVWMIGLMATLYVYAHLVGPDGILIRNSVMLTLPLACDDIRSVRARGRSLPPGGKTQFEDGVLSLGMAGGTTIDVVLARPLTLPIKQTRGEPVSEIRFHADTPDDLVAAARAHLREEVG